MKTLTKIDPKSLARLAAVMYAVFGFIAGLIISVISLFSLGSASGIGFMGVGFGVAAVIVLPIMYGAMGFVGGYVSAWIYNALAKKVGGIQFEVQ